MWELVAVLFWVLVGLNVGWLVARPDWHKTMVDTIVAKFKELTSRTDAE